MNHSLPCLLGCAECFLSNPPLGVNAKPMEKPMKKGEKQACTELDENQLIEIWKHFAVTGGADKERMVTITTWILGFSAAILGYLAINLIDYSVLAVNEPGKTRVLSCLGTLVSAYGARIVLLYAGYTNWNWAKADSLASKLKTKFKIRELLPPGQNCKEIPEPTTGPVSWPPFRDLLPIFRWFLRGAIFLLVVHLAAFVLSFIRVCRASVS
jgi:hypothetical protein